MNLLLALLILAAAYLYLYWDKPAPKPVQREIEKLQWRVRSIDALNTRHRQYRDDLYLALSRVREHHLPGFHMDPVTNMCPICRDSHIFELAQGLLGQMDFNVPPPPPPLEEP